MRPRPVIWFERVMLLAVALGILNTVLEWDVLSSRNQSAAPTWLVVAVGQGIVLGSYLLLLWFISRRGSPIARWIFVVLVVGAVLLAFVSPPPTLSMGMVPASIAIAQYLLALAGLELIFRPNAKPWFEGRRMPVDPEVFR
jgi:hypothetical protein